MAKLSSKYVARIYLSWKGRIGRGEFWGYGVALNVVWLIGLLLLGAIPSLVGALTILVWTLGLFAGYSGLLVQRGHDRGRPAIFSLALLGVRLVTWVASLVLPDALWAKVAWGLVVLYILVDYSILPGQPGENRYGPAPGGANGVNRNPLVLGGGADGEPAPSSPATNA